MLVGIVAAAGLVVGAMGPAGAAPGASPTPAPATDTVNSALSQLRVIAQQNEALSEQLNLTAADVATKQKALADAQTAAVAAAAQYSRQRSLLAATFTAQYEADQSFGQTGALLNSPTSEAYADKLSTLSLMAEQRSQMLASLGASKAAATAAQSSADALLEDASAKQDDLKQQQATLATDQKKYESLLLTLTAEQRTAYQSYGEVSQDISQYLLHTGPVAAQTAVNFALAQVGKPYVFDAAGPSTYDCSGLTMAAWAAAGVTLPHNAAAQYAYGTHVAEADLQPGDLIFMYHPIDHVTIYIGYGLMVSAPEPGDHVKVVTVASEQDIYVGATRLI
jgi:cell wall-associated NlpC family hydrolase